jgi:DUF2927 family protein
LAIMALGLAATAFDSAAWLPAALGEIPAIASRQRAERKSFTDTEITEGFLKTAFGAEFQLAGRVDRIRKYEMPVRVFAEGAARPDRRGAARHRGRRHRATGAASRYRDDGDQQRLQYRR